MTPHGKQFFTDGWAKIDNVFPAATISSAHDEFAKRYLPEELSGESPVLDSLDFPCRKVGNKRYMMAIELSGVFGDPSFYGNDLLIGLLSEQLGTEFILESFGAVLSMPGSEAQHIHFDGPGLFGVDIDGLLPSHAITVVIPLIEMNDVHGSTSIWPGSHRARGMDPSDADPDLAVSPLVPTGSVVMWDYRILHSGNANRSATPRPILYATYSRHWFADRQNWKDKVALRLPPGFLKTVPDHLKTMFQYSRES